MTAAKVMNVITTLRQAVAAVSAYTQVKLEDVPKLLATRKLERLLTPKPRPRMLKEDQRLCSRAKWLTYPPTHILLKMNLSCTSFVPSEKPKVIYSNTLEFGQACEELSWNHGTSTPFRSETNGIADKQNQGRNICSTVTIWLGRTMVGGFRGVCYPRNVLGELVKGPAIPFGSTVEYHPVSTKNQSRLHRCGKKVFVTWNFSRICIVCGRNLERRYFGRRH